MTYLKKKKNFNPSSNVTRFEKQFILIIKLRPQLYNEPFPSSISNNTIHVPTYIFFCSYTVLLYICLVNLYLFSVHKSVFTATAQPHCLAEIQTLSTEHPYMHANCINKIAYIQGSIILLHHIQHHSQPPPYTNIFSDFTSALLY